MICVRENDEGIENVLLGIGVDDVRETVSSPIDIDTATADNVDFWVAVRVALKMVDDSVDKMEV